MSQYVEVVVYDGGKARPAVRTEVINVLEYGPGPEVGWQVLNSLAVDAAHEAVYDAAVAAGIDLYPQGGSHRQEPEAGDRG